MTIQRTERDRFRIWILDQKKRREAQYKAEMQAYDTALAALASLPQASENTGDVLALFPTDSHDPVTITEAVEQIATLLPDTFTRVDMHKEVSSRYPALKCELRSFERPIKNLIDAGKLEVAEKNRGNIKPTRFRWKDLPQNGSEVKTKG